MTGPSVSLLITAGSGPAECHQAVCGVLAQMQTEADDWALAMDVHLCAAPHGARSAVLVVHGTMAIAFAKAWCGTILWRAQSRLRPHHGRANWFIGIFALPEKAFTGAQVLAHDVVFESFRAGGPGGQHQNTTDSAVRAVHRPTGLTAVSRDARSQHRNKSLALTRLQALMDANSAAEIELHRANANALHHTLQRGNPVRRFTGAAFKEVKPK